MALITRTVELAGPLDLQGSLSGLQRWGDDLLDRWDGLRWLRVVSSAGAVGAAAREAPRSRRAAGLRPSLAASASPGGSISSPVLAITTEADAMEAAVTQMAGAFVTAPGPLAELMARDPVIAAAEARHSGIRPLLTFDPLDALIRSISAQQVNLRWATETRRRLALQFGVRLAMGDDFVMELDAAALAGASVEDLRTLQFTTVKARSVIGTARAALEGQLDAGELAALGDEQLIRRLTGLFGIGRWSAEWYLARTLGRPVVVAGDLGVRKAVGRAYFGGRMPDEAEVRDATSHWGAAAGVAQQLLLRELVSADLVSPRPVATIPSIVTI